MSSQSFELAILISLKDAASTSADRVTGKLRSIGKEGKATLQIFEDLKKDFAKGLSIGAIGLAGLMALKKGADIAGDFEAAMSDLKIALSETSKSGEIDMVKLGDALNRSEQMTIKLGNKLPGTTEDFVQMVTQLKQGGLDIETILGGAGDAVANLAVVTNQVPKDTAKSFAAFGQQFELQAKDYEAAADLMARVAKSRDLSPDQLIEGSKYFQLRAGSALGFKGLEGAQDAVRLMAVLKKEGLEGSQAGTAPAAFFRELTDTKKLKELQKELGVTLSFFGKKDGKEGQFLGLENAFQQMERLRGLNPEKRDAALQKLLGDEGKAVGNILMKLGLEGYKKSNEQLERNLNLTRMIDEKTATYNAKVEALQGTLTNLKVSAFTPLLDDMKPLVDKANELVGSMVDFAQAHPDIAKAATRMAALGAVTVTVVSGVKALTTAWKMWKIVSAVTSGDSALLTFLQRVNSTTATTAAGLGGATTRAAWYKRELTGVPAMLGTTIVLTVGAEVLAYIYQLKQEADQAWEEAKGTAVSGAKTKERLYASPTSSDQIFKLSQAQAPAALDAFITGINARLRQEQLEHPSIVGPAVPLYGVYDLLKKAFYQPEASQAKIAQDLKSYMPELKMPAEFAFFMQAVQNNKKLSDGEKENYVKGASAAFPEAAAEYARAMEAAKAAGNDSTEAMRSLVEAGKSAAKSVGDLAPSANDAGRALKGLADRASSTNPAPAKTNADGTPVKVQSNAIGGRVQSDGMVHVHAGEHIVPARVSQPYSAGRTSNSGQGNTGPVYLQIFPAKGSAMAENPQAFGKQALKYVEHQMRRQRKRA